MKLLVTGATGYIGSITLRKALAAGHTVIGVDACLYGRQAFDDLAGNTLLTAIEDDFRNLPAAVLAEVDAVIHLAAISNDPTADLIPDDTYEINHEGTRRLALVCAEAGVRRFVFASSASVYDGVVGDRLDEGARVEPQGAYSRSKYFAELDLAVVARTTRRLEPVLLRQGTVFGISPRMRYDLVVQTMARAALATGEIVVHRPGSQVRPLLHINRAATVQLWAATQLTWPDTYHSLLYNVVDVNITAQATAAAVQEACSSAGRRRPAIVLADPPGRVRDYSVSGAALDELAPPRLAWERFATLVEEVVLYTNHLEDPFHPRYENLRWLLRPEAERVA